ncbi:MAG: hypothetical protein EOP47_22340 [Sphingobacteriaceae bacterium]|nr:MAG: hypothetical protein EOP47_22340 [Sphingobacteriaceae bacterium]
MHVKRFILPLIIVLFIFSCRKDPAPDKPAEKPEEAVLTVTDGASCKFANASGRNDVSLGFPRSGDRQKTSGTVKVAVIFVDFSDAVATVPPQQVFGLMSPESENFLSTVSHTKLNIVFEPQFKWYRMSRPSNMYGWENLTFDLHKSYIQEAVNLADAEYDFSKVDEIVIMANPQAGALNRSSSLIGMSGNAIVADGKTITNAITPMSDIFVFTGLLFPHEFGHSMGVPDLYSFRGPLHGYVGDFSIMGNVLGTAPTYNAWEQWLFGWFTDNQITCVRGKGTGSVQLTPVEQQDGMKLLVLPISTTAAVIVEDRRRIGYDNRIIKEGPLVYLIDNRIQTGAGVLKVLPLNTDDQVKTDAPLSVGQAVTYNGVTVKCTVSASGGSTIEYERK